eukprot:1916150-Amphidinium_carterae.2
MSDLVDHELLSIHGLVVSDDSKENWMTKITSGVVLQDFYVDADGVDSDKLKMDNLRELKVFTDVDVKTLSAEEEPLTQDW